MQQSAPVVAVEETEPTQHHSSSLQTFASLQHRNYRFLWFGTFFMSAGQWVQQVTLGWLLYDMTGSSVLLGALNGLRAIPFLLVGPIAGVVADRTDRRALLLRMQIIPAVTALAMGAMVLGKWVEPWHLFAFTAITGTAWAVIQPVRQTLVPSVVPPHHLMNAIALNSVAFNLNKIMGPVFGGLLIAAFGAGGNFLVQGAAYAGVLVMVYMMRLEHVESGAHQQSPMANLKEGFAYVLHSPMLLALMTIALVPNLFAFPLNVLMPIFQKDVFNVGPEALGLLLAGPGVGAVLATLVLASMANRIRYKGRFMLVMLVLWGLGLIAFSRISSLPAAVGVLTFVGGAQIAFNSTVNTIIQLIVPDDLRGRVMSIYMLDNGLTPLGALLAGTATAGVGAPATVLAMGIIVILLALVVAWKSTPLRDWAA